jgi:hypothetical protein
VGLEVLGFVTTGVVGFDTTGVLTVGFLTTSGVVDATTGVDVAETDALSAFTIVTRVVSVLVPVSMVNSVSAKRVS